MKKKENFSPLVYTPLSLQEAFRYLVLSTCLQSYLYKELLWQRFFRVPHSLHILMDLWLV